MNKSVPVFDENAGNRYLVYLACLILSLIFELLQMIKGVDYIRGSGFVDREEGPMKFMEALFALPDMGFWYILIFIPVVIFTELILYAKRYDQA